MTDENKLKKLVVNLLHSVHDDTLHMTQSLEQLLTLFGEDMSWYENLRKEKKVLHIKKDCDNCGYHHGDIMRDDPQCLFCKDASLWTAKRDPEGEP